MSFEKIQEIVQEIFDNSLVLIEQVNNPEIRHIYLKENLTGEQIKKLENNFKILFVSQTYDEDDKRLGEKTNQVVLVSQKEIEDLGLPETCPSCNKKVEWDWDMANFYDEQITNDATCPECGTVFEEIMEVVSWNKKEARS